MSCLINLVFAEILQWKWQMFIDLDVGQHFGRSKCRNDFLMGFEISDNDKWERDVLPNGHLPETGKNEQFFLNLGKKERVFIIMYFTFSHTRANFFKKFVFLTFWFTDIMIVDTLKKKWTSYTFCMYFSSFEYKQFLWKLLWKKNFFRRKHTQVLN